MSTNNNMLLVLGPIIVYDVRVWGDSGAELRCMEQEVMARSSDAPIISHRTILILFVLLVFRPNRQQPPKNNCHSILWPIGQSDSDGVKLPTETMMGNGKSAENHSSVLEKEHNDGRLPART